MTSRIQRLREKLTLENLDAVFVSSLPNILYVAESAGQQLQDRGDAFLLITRDKQYFFTYRMYADAVRDHLEKFTLVEIVKDSPLSSSFEKIVHKEKLHRIGYEATSLTVAEFTTLTKNIPAKNFIPSILLSYIRLQKSPDELARIQASCALGDSVLEQILPKINKNITEKQLTNEIDYLIRKNNAALSFTTIAAFGGNAAYPHHAPSKSTIEEGDAILLDFGVKKNNYCSDMSRTLFWGKASQKSRKVYQTVYDAQQKSIEYIREQLVKHEQINPGKVDQVAREYIVKKGLPPFQHASHGIGLECHELPYFSLHSDIFLEEGMIFSIEPGCYLPGELGVRIEDLFTIQKGELIQLTHAPKELIIL